MGTSGRAKGKVPLCLGESLTPKVRDGLTECCAGGKTIQILGYMRMTEIIGLKKNSEKPIESKSVFVRDNIRFRRVSTTNQIHSCGFYCGRILGKKNVLEFRNNPLVIAFREKSDFIHAHAQNWCH
jgi:hypothetical protein